MAAGAQGQKAQYHKIGVVEADCRDNQRRSLGGKVISAHTLASGVRSFACSLLGPHPTCTYAYPKRALTL